MRNLNPRGRLFIVTPLLVDDRDSRIKLSDAVAEQIYRELDRGLRTAGSPATCASAPAECGSSRQSGTRCPSGCRISIGANGRVQRRRQPDVLEEGRDAGNRRVLRRTSVGGMRKPHGVLTFLQRVCRRRKASPGCATASAMTLAPGIVFASPTAGAAAGSHAVVGGDGAAGGTADSGFAGDGGMV